MKYTIAHATPTGKSHPTYGAEYILRFEEDERNIKVNRKFPPKPGAVMMGDIVKGVYGDYFKKDPTAQDNPPSQSSHDSNGTTKEAKTFNVDAMFVSYVKDLMINYLNALNWDFSKVKYDDFENVVSVVGSSAHTLSNPSSQKEPLTTDDVVNSWN